ncbi:hypothetical protein LNN38_05170 [Pseudomonas sp. LA21]|uniref:hypothetical protein n=1 Tax=unclassified Pseudomonas TaxID=196821 RepID=UPI001FB62449|nr:hypothetical protein [Pseudomonas sp. LA21]MCJ1884234.1 hypothetical protein [Pseudomonas sp. LA21]
MKPLIAAASIIFLFGCASQTTSDVFGTGSVDYKKINIQNPVARAETRLFIRNGSGCDYLSTRPEGAFGVEIGLFVAKQGLDYLAEYMKAKADYLSSDVTISGKSSLSIEGRQPYWPQEESIMAIAKEKEGILLKAKNQAMALYKSETDPEKKKKAIDAALAEASAKFDKEREKTVTLTNSDQDLCILVIAGKYYPNGDGKAAMDKFAQANNADTGKLGDYHASTPTILVTDDVKPFDGLKDDPTMVLELHVVATEKTNTILYTIVPTNLFYPRPLHKGTVNGLERKLTITTKLGDLPTSITLDHMISGSPYTVSQLAKAANSFETDKERRFQQVEVTVSEGPDKLPTAKALKAAADKEDLAYKAIEKNLVKLYGSNEQKAALKK